MTVLKILALFVVSTAVVWALAETCARVVGAQ
jgi:hypothetical protein